MAWLTQFLATWTFAPFTSGRNSRFPFMSLLTLPPRLITTHWQKLRGSSLFVFSRMPFRSKLRIDCLQVIFPRDSHDSCAIWATASHGTSKNYRFPFMSFFTLPPHFFVAHWKTVIRTESFILCRMPLSRKLRIDRLQVIFPWNSKTMGTIRAVLLVAPV